MSDGGSEPDDVGTVYLVGSGPGDPDLLTVKASRLLDEADVVLHDKLPGPDIIDSIPEDKREDVAPGATPMRLSVESFSVPPRFRERFKNAAEVDEPADAEESPEDFGIDEEKATYKYDTGR